MFGPNPTVHDLRRIHFYVSLFPAVVSTGDDRLFTEFLFCAVSDIENRMSGRPSFTKCPGPASPVDIDPLSFQGLQHLASPSQVFCQRVRNVWDKFLDLLVSALP
jgi:hypothetical protein